MDHKVKAAIFDLDGVITETASLHAKAWKKMFDAYNEKRKEQGKDTYKSFSIEEDYPVHIDGIPRYDGVQEFLKSQDIELPYGSPDNGPDKETVCGLGNWKNEIFNEVIEAEGVPVLEKNVEKVKEWRQNGLKTAIISSSKNCKKLLEKAGLEHLFDVRVDGMVSAERNIKGKPAPDIFLEAAKDLNVKPEECIVIEDALSGVEAGSKGNFHLVIGINNDNRKEGMLKAGADTVVNNLQEFHMNNKRKPKELSSAMDHVDQFIQEMEEHQTLLCLDYDGTLTPIVEDYKRAFLSDEMRQKLKEASKVVSIAIVSGRDLRFIKEKVDLEELFYAGSHGFEIEGPDDFHYEIKESKEILPVLDDAEGKLQEKLKAIEGVEIERKKYAIAIHYRKVKEADLKQVNKLVNNLIEEYEKLIRTEGKKVIELKPDIDWDKGKAVKVVGNQILSNEHSQLVFYLGDDVTDEDAFQVIENGYGILVGRPEEESYETYANYFLNDVEEVKAFLTKLTSKKNV